MEHTGDERQILSLLAHELPELVAPKSPDSPVLRSLASDEVLHHLLFRVSGLRSWAETSHCFAGPPAHRRQRVGLLPWSREPYLMGL